jgi:hypothetical protein
MRGYWCCINEICNSLMVLKQTPAWKEFSRYVRSEAKGQCFTCPKRSDPREMDAGHRFHSCSIHFFDPRFVRCQCTDYTLRVQQQEERLDAIDSLEGFHVRRGHLAYRKRRRQEEQKGQKEIDVLLAVDMMTNSFNMTISLPGQMHCKRREQCRMEN